MRRSLRGLGEALRLPEDFWRFGPPTIHQRLTAQIMGPAVPGRDRSLAATLDVIPTLPTIALQAELLSGPGEEPWQTRVRVSAQPGPIVSTVVRFFENGVERRNSDDYHGQGGELSGLAQLGPARWRIVVQRQGVDPRGAVLVEQAFETTVRAHPTPPPPPPPPPTAPAITATVAPGSMVAITGTGFLANQPNNVHGIAIRLVDANNPQDFRLYNASSDASGAIGTTVGPVLIDTLVRNALGQAVLAVSATDSRTDRTNQPLWSNTVRLTF